MQALAAEGLVKRYGEQVALAGVDIRVNGGELLGLLGPNGAGKSTLVKIACGLVRRSEGTIAVCGGDPSDRSVRSQIGYLPELFRFQPWMTADEVLTFHQELARSTGAENERADLLGLVDLADAATRRVGHMSKGMQQRLGLAQALIGNPKLLLLDEPTSALDPTGRRAVRKLLLELKARGVAVLLNSHLLTEVELVCDRVVIIRDGQVVAQGSPSELTGNTGIEIETGDGTRTYPNASRDEVPGIVAELVAEGERIYSVRGRQNTLEEVYLQVIESNSE
jgi:ABC-2 type transport system ATP-binding protein